MPTADTLDRRVLLCAPTGRDARLVGHILAEAGIDYHVCDTPDQLVEEIGKGAGAVLVAEEALSHADQLLLAARMSGQPRWSDLALILLTIRGGATPTVGSALRALGNITLLERPLRAWALLSVVRSALRARARQYELRDQFTELERVVIALREAETTLREADRRKDEFLASLAHELRNPLAPIRNCVGLLKMAKEPDAKLISVTRDVIDRQSLQLSRLVDDLLDLSRITRGTVSLQRRQVALADIVRNAVETSDPALRAAGVKLEQANPVPSGHLDVDPVRIAQAISNILNNAAKFTPEGGTVLLDAACKEGVATIRIRDNGAGIDPQMIRGIFDLFVQEHRPDGRWKAGLGIGLTLVKRFVELHGGSVSAASEGPGKGSEFIITLPCVVEASCDKPPAATEGESMEVRPILVVDDNRDNARTMSELLGALGFDVRIAYDGEEALSRVREAVPDIVLMDIGMPEMDGFEVARRIRSHPGGDDCVIIAMTGWSQEDYRARARSAGFDHHLVKPVDLDRLKKLLVAAPAARETRAASQFAAD